MSEARRQKLWLIMFSLILFGVIAVAHVFVASWHTPANASTDSIRFDTATLADGQFAVVDLDKESKTGFKLFIIRDGQQFNVFGFLAHYDGFMMPDKSEWRVSGHCEKLVYENKIIFCADLDILADEKDRWRWDFSGNNISGQDAKLRHIKFDMVDGLIVVKK